MRSLSIILFGLSFCLSVYAQEPVLVERSSNKVIIENKVYYIHVVKPGQTLYSISKAYDVSQKEITIENPAALYGLQIGQALKIPVISTSSARVDDKIPEHPEDSIIFHIIREGETLYSISRFYDVHMDSILSYNKDLDITSMSIGDALIIPMKKVMETTEGPVFNEEGYIYHKVKRKETLYSISRLYQVSIENIRSSNPELGWGGPRTGQVLKIPKPQFMDMEFIPADTIISVSTDTLLTDTLADEYTYRELYFEDYRPRKTYKVAFLIPFDYHQSEPLEKLLMNVQSQNERNRITERYRLEQAAPQSVNLLEFFEGALLAVDSVRKSGMKLDIRFYDTKRSISRVSEILKMHDLKDMDLIIGPFYSYNLESVSAFCKEHNIPLITPFYSDYQFVKYNPYLFQISSSVQIEYQYAARYIARNFDKNIVLVHSGDSSEITGINYFKEQLFNEFHNYADIDDVIFKEVVLDIQSTTDLVHSLTAQKQNLVVVLTGDEALASRIISALYFQLRNFNIEIFGTSYWPEFLSIDIKYLHALHLTIPHNGIINYNDPSTKKFLTDYRRNYLAEPEEKTRNGNYYAMIGYDVTQYFLEAIREYGKRFILHLDRYDPDLIIGKYRFKRVSLSGGYENTHLRYFRYNPDMTVKEITLPEEILLKDLTEPLREHTPPSFLYLDRERPVRER